MGFDVTEETKCNRISTATLIMPVIYEEDAPGFQKGFLEKEQKKTRQLLNDYVNMGFHITCMSSVVFKDVLWNSYVLEKKEIES